MYLCIGCGEKTTGPSCHLCNQDARLKSRFELHELLGQGVTGSTYKAWDTIQETWLAIKEIPWRVSDGPKAQKRLLREAEILSQIQHSQAPSYIHHFILKEGRHQTLYILQEFIEGPTLLTQINTRRFSLPQIWKIAEDLLIVLSYLHGLSPPVIHRDIKPANIIYNKKSDSYVLIDFGSVRDAITDESLASSTFAGTFGYIAPEQLQGLCTPQSDLYSLGMLLIRLLTRKEPSQLIDHNLHVQWEKHISLPENEKRFIAKLIAVNPQQRWQSAQLALSVLRALNNPQQDRKAPLDFLQEIRNVIREEIREESLKQQEVLAEQLEKIPSQQNVSIPSKVTKDTHDPLAPVLLAQRPSFTIPSERKGWWEPRPMPPEVRQRPTHPATQLVMMTGLFMLFTILLQLIL